MLLEINRAVSHIAGNPVLRGVSLNLDRGETVALIGRNGAGKTSLLRTVMGILPLKEGSMQFAGADLGGLPSHDRAGLGIGYAPEERRLIGKFTVYDNILVPAWSCGLSDTVIAQRLELIYTLAPELKDMSGRLGGLLSGGQQKIVALARALMAGESMILLDEPFQGLAPALARRYADSLRTLRQEQPDLAILIAESNPKLLEPMADRFISIERGEITSITDRHQSEQENGE